MRTPSGQRRWSRGLMALAAIAAVTAWLPARAASVPELERELVDLERLSRNLRIKYQAQQISQSQQAETRLVDAQVLYSLKDYTRAAILLLDYVHKYKDTRGYPEALFYLADSLYNKRDFISAKKYFEVIVREIRGSFYQDALQRLVELSLRTEDTSSIQEYLDALANIPVSQLKPSVPYVRAKYYYFIKDTDKALINFRYIPQGHKYYHHSQYFIGAALVRKKDLSGAMKVFQDLVRQYPKTQSEKHVRDLSYLAVGRIFYEKNKMADAIEWYQKVSRQSPEFDTSLYEIAWAYVKQADFDKALRALELLVLANPDSPFIPDVKVLQGNLLIRQKKWGSASSLFTKTREKYLPVHNRMKQVMTEHQDPNLFFDLLLKRNQGSFAVKIQVPDLAVHWVKERPGIQRALALVSDVRDIKDSLKEADQIIRELEKAIESPAKINIFPEFAASKAQALEVENRLELARSRILDGERKLAMPLATGGEKDRLHQLATQRSTLESQIKNLPTQASGYQERQQAELVQIEALEKELNRQSITIDNLRAQLVASVKYAEDTEGKRKPAVMMTFRKEAMEVKQLIESLQEEVDDLSTALREARVAAGVGGAAEVSERKIKARYRDVAQEEHKLLSTLLDRLSPEARSEFLGYSAIMDRCVKLDQFLKDFDSKLAENLDERLKSIRQTIVEEKESMAIYAAQLSGYSKETDDVAGNLTYASFRDVAQRFYDIIVRADVGIIDVAWALKDARSKDVSQLVRQRKMDIKTLDDEFKEVLREE